MSSRAATLEFHWTRRFAPKSRRPGRLARVKTISLGGAYLESPRKLTVGDSIKLEVRAGLRKINFTAVVRNIGRTAAASNSCTCATKTAKTP